MPAFKGKPMTDGAGSFQKGLQAVQRLLCGLKQLRGDWREAGDLNQVASQREAFPFKMLFRCHRLKPLNGGISRASLFIFFSILFQLTRRSKERPSECGQKNLHRHVPGFHFREETKCSERTIATVKPRLNPGN